MSSGYMKQKGQIISLDFLISVIGVTLAVGLLIQFSELKTYSEKEDTQWLELKQAGEIAGDLLVSNHATACDVTHVVDGTVLFNLMNCIDTSKAITRERLGIPDSYGFSVEGGGISEGDGDLAEKNYYSTKRLAVTNNGSISKQEYEEGSFDSGADPVEVVVKVWKE